MGAGDLRIRIDIDFPNSYSALIMNREAYERARGGTPGRVIAARADLAEAYLSRIINGHLVPSVAIARRIADALGTTIDELWPTRGNSPPPTGTDAPRVISIRDAGRKGGAARAARLTAAQRSDAARKAVEARWRAVRATREESSRSRWDVATERYVSAANDATYRRTVAA